MVRIIQFSHILKFSFEVLYFGMNIFNYLLAFCLQLISLFKFASFLPCKSNTIQFKSGKESKILYLLVLLCFIQLLAYILIVCFRCIRKLIILDIYNFIQPLVEGSVIMEEDVQHQTNVAVDMAGEADIACEVCQPITRRHLYCNHHILLSVSLCLSLQIMQNSYKIVCSILFTQF